MIIDVWSDVVCPWCFIGKRRLDKAIAALPAGTQVTVRHRAFQLDPTRGQTAPTAEVLAMKYNVTPEQVGHMQARVCAIADGEGLCYDLDQTLSGNTADAHRLLLWAGHAQGALLEAMYSSYFEHRGSLFDRTSLLALVTAVGLDAHEAADVLDSDEFRGEVSEDQHVAAQLGASGVPFVLVDSRYAISGAQDQSVFDHTLLVAAQEGAVDRP